MNGLKYIRTQCNFSLSKLADRLDVSRQIISAWENGKKEIPEARKEQLAEFFGIDKCFFGEITEEQKKTLLGKAMFRYIESGVETYRYKPNVNAKSQTAYFAPEREMSLDEEFVELQRTQKQLLERINCIISGPEQANLRDQMSFIVRGTEVFGKVADAMDGSFSKESSIKMPYYFGMLEVLQALNTAMDLSDEVKKYNLSSEKSSQQLVTLIMRIFEKKVDEIKIPANHSEEKCSIHSKGALSMQEKIGMAEEEYSKFDKPDDMKMFSINLDYRL